MAKVLIEIVDYEEPFFILRGKDNGSLIKLELDGQKYFVHKLTRFARSYN